MAHHTVRVALLVNTEYDYDRKIISGISQYAQQAGNWTIFCEDEHLHEMPPLGRWHGDGVIAHLESPATHQSVYRARR